MLRRRAPHQRAPRRLLLQGLVGHFGVGALHDTGVQVLDRRVDGVELHDVGLQGLVLQDVVLDGLVLQRLVLGCFRGGGLALVDARLLVGPATRRRHATGTTDGGLGAARVAQRLEAIVVQTRHDHRDVTGALEDLSGATTRTWREALHRDALVGVGGRDEELFGEHRVVRDGVRDGGGEDSWR